MNWGQVAAWVKRTLPAFGGIGIFVSAFLDSSFLPLPLVTDLMVMELSSRTPVRMPYFAGMAAIGSVVGCIWIYALARKGGLAYYRRRQENPPGRIREWVQKYPLTSVVLPAVAPFPVPFKPFVIAQGVFQVPFLPFLIGTFLGRGALFLAEGFLAVRYGEAAREFVLHQKWASLGVLAALIGIVLLVRLLPRLRRISQTPTNPRSD